MGFLGGGGGGGGGGGQSEQQLCIMTRHASCCELLCTKTSGTPLVWDSIEYKSSPGRICTCTFVSLI